VDLVFSASFLLVAPFWGLMIAAPRWRVTEQVVRSPWIVAPVALLYLMLIAPDLPSLLGTLSAPDLATISAALATDRGATIAWAHFLAFDLFVGRWIYLDARPRSVAPLLLGVLLLFTLMLGPIGLLGYLLVRARRPAAPATPRGD
jgi:hypothetical protein